MSWFRHWIGFWSFCLLFPGPVVMLLLLPLELELHFDVLHFDNRVGIEP
jgi:hypothetical protein